MKNWKDYFVYALAGLIVLGFIGVMVILIFHLAPESNNTLLNVLAGAFATMTIQVVNFYFGSSKGSADKTSLLAQAQPIIDKVENLVK